VTGPGSTQGASQGSCGDPCWVEPDDHAIGRSRGGLTTKLHMLTDGRGRALVLHLTAGNVNDCPTFPQLMDGLRVARPGPARDAPAPARTTSGATRATARGPTGNCCAAAGSPTPSPSLATNRATDSAAGRPVAVRSGSTRPNTSDATSSNAASTSSKGGEAWPAATTNTPATTAARSPSPPY